jgi:hypothetical protein
MSTLLETPTLIEYPPLMRYRARYQEIPVQPLLITAILRPNAPVVSYDPIHLDNFLAWCVVMDSTMGQGLPPSDDPYDLPIPIQRLWRDDRGLPLYASTVFMPDGVSFSDQAYWHKRAQSGRFTGTKSGRFPRETIKGRWMERRVPVPVTVCRRWTARCIGNAAEILSLLQNVCFIGKRRSSGFGEVEEWMVEPLSLDLAGPSILVDDGCLTRPIPSSAAELLPSPPAEPPQLVGWAMPQWKPSLFAEGWRAGTPVETSSRSTALPASDIDFFAAVDSL